MMYFRAYIAYYRDAVCLTSCFYAELPSIFITNFTQSAFRIFLAGLLASAMCCISRVTSIQTGSS